jgi:glycerophosphoryl diester phosphodiesterase
MDYLPVSENSLEMIRMAARLGATGIEVDVRLTADGVPVLLHDNFLSAHTLRNTVYGGLVEKHTLASLKEKELRKGGRIPTLRETLHTVLYETPLQVVWLDIKFDGELTSVRSLQIEFLQKAKEIGRDLQILMGLPTKAAMRCFEDMEDHQLLPSLTEMEPEDVHRIKARVWAPQYTSGTQDEVLASMHAAGVKCYVWSLDDPAMIDEYLNKSSFDGIVTNTPPTVAYQYYWTRVRSGQGGEKASG